MKSLMNYYIFRTWCRLQLRLTRWSASVAANASSSRLPSSAECRPLRLAVTLPVIRRSVRLARWVLLRWTAWARPATVFRLQALESAMELDRLQVRLNANNNLEQKVHVWYNSKTITNCCSSSKNNFEEKKRNRFQSPSATMIRSALTSSQLALVSALSAFEPLHCTAKSGNQ